jgi:hypothetical protein
MESDALEEQECLGLEDSTFDACDESDIRLH